MNYPTLAQLYSQQKDKYKAFLFDIDGTVLLMNSVIPGADRFLEILKKDKVPFYFLTNNCAQTHEEIAARLTKAGIPAEPDQIISSGDHVPKYFKRNNTTGKAWKYFLVGRANDIPGVVEFEKDPEKIMECDGVLHNAGLYDWRIVLTAILNFYLKFPEKPLIVTNGDFLNPVEDGKVTICSNGQMDLVISLLKRCGIEKERVHFGKPYAPIYEEVEEKLNEIGVSKENTYAVGDWLNSDVYGANLAGIHSCLVLTGLSTTEDIEAKGPEYHPELIVSTLI